jgi:hypothetical protein
MNQFEIWQVVNMTVQSALQLLTLIAASYVGIKQYQINRRLVEMEHEPSVEVAINTDKTEDELRVLNKGSKSIWLWGTQLEKTPKLIESEPRLITPQGNYYILLKTLKSAVLERVGSNGEERLSLTLFMKTSDKRMYVVRVVLLCCVENLRVTLHSQTVAIEQEDWVSDT